ncbi:secreted RxLR effector protein 161-like [Lactuca sativa]|uniref:secreted RxLR effector protein 161-like n=1 Tax=Lactuca sativa TaxID=4236 RepID=UPI001C68931F|nr:secreted RxLR effector protein 161-like [Lactuca sativa]
MKTLLAKFGMVGDSRVKVPMTFRTKLTPSLDKPTSDMTLYRQMIGSLMFQVNPREPHMTAVKSILHYLKRTTSLGIWYPSNSGFFVQVYSDVDLGRCGLDRKSTTGGCQFLDGKLVSRQSKKQTCVSLYTVKAKYIATASCTSQVVWIQSQLRDYGINMKRIPLYCAIDLS